MVGGCGWEDRGGHARISYMSMDGTWDLGSKDDDWLSSRPLVGAAPP